MEAIDEQIALTCYSWHEMPYQPDRRDFFGIVAAPLFRNIVPPTPMGNTLSVAGLLGALKELERPSVGPPVSITGTVYMRTFPGNPYEHLAKDGQ